MVCVTNAWQTLKQCANRRDSHHAFLSFLSCLFGNSPVAQMVNCLPAMWETWVWSLGREDPLEKEMATHSSTLAWKIAWTEGPGRLQSMGSQRVRQDWANSLHFIMLSVNEHLEGSGHFYKGSDLGWDLRRHFLACARQEAVVHGALYRSQHFQSPHCSVHQTVKCLKSSLQENLKVIQNQSSSVLQPSLQ